MKWKYLIIFFLVVLLIGIFGYLYYAYEKPLSNLNENYGDTYIFAVNQKGEKISTGFKIIDDFQVQETTSKYGDVLVKIPINSTIRIMNYNLKNQNYYTFISERYLILNDSNRIKIVLEEPAQVMVNFKGDITNISNLTISSKGKLKNPLLCFQWSIHFIYINALNLTFAEIPLEYNKYNKCYSIERDLNNENFVVNIQSKVWNALNEKDFANAILIDREFIENTLYYHYEEKNIGAEDFTIKIL